uniref:uncharacterized protein n=1 Tax=Semicossyphus pulcher TaxID=241346 RepID=UPI0037E81F9D
MSFLLAESDLLIWSVNESKDIVRYSKTSKTIFRSYSGRAEYFAQNLSLLLKNVQEDDSGDYRADVSADHRIDVAEYKVTVQDPVSPVKLTVKHCSTDSSNLTVTCSTLDSLISSTFTCVNQTCSHERGELSEFSTSAASLRVYLENGSVICNHSNQVSWKKDIKGIEDLCKKSADSESVSAGISVCQVKTAVFSVGLIIMVSAIISVHVIEKLKKTK